MKTNIIEVGTLVVFSPKVFNPLRPWYPYYENYKGQVFKVVGYLEDKEEGTVYDHIFLECVSDPTVTVDGCVHDYDVIPIPKMNIDGHKHGQH
jgi:hypothetical protein